VFFSRSLHYIFSGDDDDDDGDELKSYNAFSYATPEALLDDSRFLWRMALLFFSMSVSLSLPDRKHKADQNTGHNKEKEETRRVHITHNSRIRV